MIIRSAYAFASLRSRRTGKVDALARWRAVQEELGTHAHLLYPDRTVCVNGQCPELPRE